MDVSQVFCYEALLEALQASPILCARNEEKTYIFLSGPLAVLTFSIIQSTSPGYLSRQEVFWCQSESQTSCLKSTHQ